MSNAQISAVPTFKPKIVVRFGLSHFINDLMTVGIVPALLPLYRDAYHLTYTRAGLIVLLSYLMSSVMQPLFGYLTDKYPKTWLLPFGVVLSTLGLALTGLATNFTWLLILISLSGLGSGAFHPEASRGTHLAAGSAKGRAQAIFQVGGNLGQAFGPLMVRLAILQTGLKGLPWFSILAVVSLFLTLPTLPWYRETLHREHNKRREIAGRNNIPGLILLVVVVVLRSFCQIGVAGFLPFFFAEQHVGYSVSETYTFLFLGAGALGTFLGGSLSDRIGKKRLLLFSMLVAIPFAWLLPHASGIWIVLDLVLFGFSVLSSFAVTVVYCQTLLPRNIALASGLMIGFGVGAGGIGATLLGHISDVYGVATVFDILGFLPIAATVLSLFLPNDRARSI